MLFSLRLDIAYLEPDELVAACMRCGFRDKTADEVIVELIELNRYKHTRRGREAVDDLMAALEEWDNRLPDE
jgi:hypothetical protein